MRAKQTKPLNTRLLLEIRSGESRHGCLTKLPKRLALSHRRGRNAGNTAKVVLFFSLLLFHFPSSARNSPAPSQLAAEFGIHGGGRLRGDNFLAQLREERKRSTAKRVSMQRARSAKSKPRRFNGLGERR